jgi:tetratricopeptide (TPR) repeat protein
MIRKKFLILMIAVCTASAGVGYAQQRRAAPVRKAAPRAGKPVARPAPSRPAVPVTDRELQTALNLAKTGDYLGASSRLFVMTRNPKFADQRIRIKYILGLMLFEMKMYQVSAFQFVDVVRSGDKRYTKQALQKLSFAADILNDDTLINYAIGKVAVEEFPRENQDMLRYRIGEYFQRKESWDQAVGSFSKVPANSPYFAKSKYLEGLAHVKRNDLNAALQAFQTLLESRQGMPVTDVNRVSAIMGMARVLYQSKKWDQAVDFYRQVPRDTDMWHDSLFEISWAHMRGAQFRSVLSSLHSLHSPYYEDFYLPESILLRGIVYLYICQYDEMEKSLALFERIYQPIQNRLDDFTRTTTDPVVYFNELERVIRNFNLLKANTEARRGYRIPFLVARDIGREGDFRRVYAYINKLREELQIVNSQPPQWRKAVVGTYSTNLLKGRLETSIKLAGNMVRAHMVNMRLELADMFEQYNFGRYEMLNGKKEALKKKIQGKGVVSAQVDDAQNRDFYIQNGYEYWPFRGEYWLDEIGDYHYLGTQGCE